MKNWLRLGLSLTAVLLLLACGGGGDDDDGTLKTPAESLVGTYRLTGVYVTFDDGSSVTFEGDDLLDAGIHGELRITSASAYQTMTLEGQRYVASGTHQITWNGPLGGTASVSDSSGSSEFSFYIFGMTLVIDYGEYNFVKNWGMGARELMEWEKISNSVSAVSPAVAENAPKNVASFPIRVGDYMNLTP